MTSRELAPTRPLNQQDRDQLRGLLRQNAVPILSTLGNVLFNRPAFVARQDDEGPFGNVVKALTRYNCRRWASSDKSNFSTRVNAFNADICNPYLQSIGEAPQDGEAGLQFLGGQCDGVAYDITATDNRVSIGGTGVYRVTGPFGGTRVVVSNRDAQGRPNTYNGQIFARRWWLPGANPPAIGEPRWISVFNTLQSPPAQAVTFITNSVVRLGGGVDNCGNPPPVIRQPDRIFPVNPVPPSITVNIPGFGPQEVNITFDGVGNPTFNFPELGFSFDVAEDSGGGGGGGATPPGGGGDGAPGQPDAVGEPAFDGDPGEGGEEVDFGEPPQGKVWVGAFVRMNAATVVGSIPGSQGNRAYPRVVGNASLVYQGGRGEARQQRSQWMELVRPVTSLQVTGCFVNNLPGVNTTIFPISAIVCPESTCGVE